MKRRGFLLIVCLLLGLVLFALGVGLLTQKQMQYDLAVQSNLCVQARGLARAGLEDALAKATRDQKFPPDSDQDQTLYSYTEELRDGNFEGSYEVEIDQSLKGSPWKLLIVTSHGRVGSAHYILRGELLLTPPRRWISQEDLGTR